MALTIGQVPFTASLTRSDHRLLFHSSPGTKTSRTSENCLCHAPPSAEKTHLPPPVLPQHTIVLKVLRIGSKWQHLLHLAPLEPPIDPFPYPS